MRAAPLWTYLLVLVGMAALPMVAAATLWLWGHAERERAKLSDALAAQAQALSLAMEREVNGIGDVLDALGRSPHLEARDFAAFHAHASRIAESRRARFISLFSPDGQQLLNTARPYGTALPSPFDLPAAGAAASAPPKGDAGSLRRVIQERTRSNSNLFRALVDDKLALTVDVPVYIDGALRYALNIGLEPSALDRLVRAVSTDEQSIIVIDGRDVVLARSNTDGSPVGAVAGPAYVEARRKAASFVSEGVSRNGVRTVFAAHTSAATGWTTVVATPRDQLDAAARQSWIAAAVALGLTFGVGCLWAGLLARRIVRTVGVLTAGAGADGKPPRVDLPATEFLVLRQRQIEAQRAERAAEAARLSMQEAQLRQTLADQASQAKDRFIATLAHELRGPLQVIGLCIAQLLRRPDSLPALHDRLQRQFTHITRLVDELADEAAVSRGKVQLHRRPVDVAALVDDAVQELRERTEGDPRPVTVAREGTGFVVDGDAVRLRQVVRNLLDNAAKYSPAGSPIELQLRADGAALELAIRDHGQGIDPADLERAFQPFEQLGDTTAYRGGLGLGLPLARNLARLHGGDLRLESEGTRGGCTARLHLPLAATPPA